MWINRNSYDGFMRLEAQLAKLGAELIAANRHIAWLENQEAILRFELKEARQKTDYAIDELLKQKNITPISPDAAERRVLTDALDNIWEEDLDAVTRLRERVVTEGVADVYSEAMQELTANE